ncbi:nitric oxide reductase activation protein NorD [Litchfieldella xinjiangensis]|uniref:nitric oxide reductase activation protein NorD n=1 Tax=Litchfieldella xinjiangensis TaxID=1166948 RepID=UPI0005B7C6E1|nr:VWA domain-containing protein [Halomonas xinjiangensis]
MAEAEDVITDVARHATVYAQGLWRRYRAPHDTPGPIGLEDVAERLELLLQAAFGNTHSLRIAQPPAPPTLLDKLFRRGQRPRRQCAVPATDGVQIWLPAHLGIHDYALALARYRTMALQQAIRAQRGSAPYAHTLDTPLKRHLYLIFEAWAADAELVKHLPGMALSINDLKQYALSTRPALKLFPGARQPLESVLRQVLGGGGLAGEIAPPAAPLDSAALAERMSAQLSSGSIPNAQQQSLLLDYWTGDLRQPPSRQADDSTYAVDEPEDDLALTRSARLERRPEVREAREDEDEEQQPGLWMVQSAQPQEHAEDPMGMQRPADRDQATPAEDFADSLSELNEARLVTTPGSPKEVLLADDPPETRPLNQSGAGDHSQARFNYPEWDYRARAYRNPGASIHLLETPLGRQRWIDETLETYRSLLDSIRRQFEMLRARRVRLRRQLDGDEIDLDAYQDGLADTRAGLSMPQAVYQTQRTDRRDMAIMLLVDASGSTDSWLSKNRRIIDVEREALLLVCLALEGLGEPYSVQAFSGEGPQTVTIRSLKRFDERYSAEVGRRIAALEPERYTRTGTAIRHASTLLMQEPAEHRLLLLLSDGKPNDMDEYEGRYGVEDTRQAVTEAKLQGIYPFCLTIDRQAASYLPVVFGAQQYALLTEPERLPSVLLTWLKRLLTI